MGSKTFFYFVLTSVLAVCVGIIIVNVIAPGKLQDKTSLLLLSPESPTVQQIGQQVQGGVFEKIEQIFMEIIPSNILAVAAQGKLLGLIFFSILFGFLAPR